MSVCLSIQLPACLCIHIQRTVWLNSGVAVKRFDHVSFTEVLDMSPYVYCKRGAPKQRPKTLDVDPATRLVGGRHSVTSGSQRSVTYVTLAVCLVDCVYVACVYVCMCLSLWVSRKISWHCASHVVLCYLLMYNHDLFLNFLSFSCPFILLHM